MDDIKVRARLIADKKRKRAGGSLYRPDRTRFDKRLAIHVRGMELCTSRCLLESN